MRKQLAVILIAMAATWGVAAPNVDAWWACESVVGYLELVDQSIALKTGSQRATFTLRAAMLHEEQLEVVDTVVRNIGTNFEYMFTTNLQHLTAGALDVLRTPTVVYWVYFQHGGGVACIIEMRVVPFHPG